MLKKRSFLIISAVALLGLLLSGCSADTANGKIEYDHVAMPEETDLRLILINRLRFCEGNQNDSFSYQAWRI